MMPDFPQDDFEFHQAWTHCAGHLGGLRQAINLIDQTAALEFISKKDNVANALRSLAALLQISADEYSKDLSAFIKEAGRRIQVKA